MFFKMSLMLLYQTYLIQMALSNLSTNNNHLYGNILTLNNKDSSLVSMVPWKKGSLDYYNFIHTKKKKKFF